MGLTLQAIFSTAGLALLAITNPAAADDPSGQNMPTASWRPWTKVWDENFLTDAPLGTFSSKYGAKFYTRGADWDASPKNRSVKPSVDTYRRGIYSPKNTLSVKDGLLDIWLHTAEGPDFGSDKAFVDYQTNCKTPTPCKLDNWTEIATKPWVPGVPYVGVLTPLAMNGKPEMHFGRYTVRFKVEYPKSATGAPLTSTADGFKTAWLLWPEDDKGWPKNGEIDYPEGQLSENSFSAYHHFTCNNTDGSPTECQRFRDKQCPPNKPGCWQADFENIASYSDWHTATIEWMPNRINFLLDGKPAKTRTNPPRNATTSERVPGSEPRTDPNVDPSTVMMKWIMQSETELNYNPIPQGNQVHIKIDWAVVWKYTP